MTKKDIKENNFLTWNTSKKSKQLDTIKNTVSPVILSVIISSQNWDNSFNKNTEKLQEYERFFNDPAISKEEKKWRVDELIASWEVDVLISNYEKILSNLRDKDSLLNDWEFIKKLSESWYKDNILQYIDNAEPIKSIHRDFSNIDKWITKISNMKDIVSLGYTTFVDNEYDTESDLMTNVFWWDYLVNDWNIPKEEVECIQKIMKIQKKTDFIAARCDYDYLFNESDDRIIQIFNYFSRFIDNGLNIINIKDVEEYSSKLKGSPYYDYIFLHVYNLEQAGLFQSFDTIKNMKDTKLQDLLLKNLLHREYGHIDRLLWTEHFAYLLSLPNYKELLDFDFAPSSWVPVDRQFHIQKKVVIDWEHMNIIMNWFMEKHNFSATGWKYIVWKQNDKKVFIFDDSMSQHKFIADKYWINDVLGGWRLDFDLKDKQFRLNPWRWSKMYGDDPYLTSWITQKAFDSLLEN